MPMKTYKPTTPSRRFITILDTRDITKKKPERSLLLPLKSSGGRNNTGRLTVRHKGGGNGRKYRFIDFRREKFNVPAVVLDVEYDPNRNTRIALVKYNDGERRYIILPEGLKIGDQIMSGDQADVKIGNALFLKNIPEGTVIHNVELEPGKGAKMVRSAGTFAQLLAKEGRLAQIKLASGEVRVVSLNCLATVGQVGNIEYKNISLGKAGKNRWLGVRPTVRGTAMNAVDHPHGGGRGKSKGANQPRSPWGQLAKGGKTRGHKASDVFIINRRPKGPRGM